VQTVYARVQSLAAGATAYLVLSSAAVGATSGPARPVALQADRYVVALSASGTSVFRCAGASCPAALTASSSASVLTSYSPATLAPISDVRVDVTYSSANATTVVVYNAQSTGAATVVVSATDPSPAAALVTLRSFGVAASAAGARFSGLCFANSAAAAGSKATSRSAPQTGAITTLQGLNYEAQPAGFGLEVKITDVIASGSLAGAVFNQPGPLSEYATVLVAVGDVNEAPFWPTLTACAAPASSNVYVSAPATLSTTAASFVACFYVPENSDAVELRRARRAGAAGGLGTRRVLEHEPPGPVAVARLLAVRRPTTLIAGSGARLRRDPAASRAVMLIGGAATCSTSRRRC
jgi:hypothetical protein